MYEPPEMTKITIEVRPEELRALIRVGLKLSDGFGMSKTKLGRLAIGHFIESNGERIVYKGELSNGDTGTAAATDSLIQKDTRTL